MSATRSSPCPEDLLARLRASDPEHPTTDRDRAEEALRRHFRALGIKPPPVRWVADVPAGCAEVVAAAIVPGARGARWDRFTAALWAAIGEKGAEAPDWTDDTDWCHEDAGSMTAMISPEYLAAFMAFALRAYVARTASPGAPSTPAEVVGWAHTYCIAHASNHRALRHEATWERGQANAVFQAAATGCCRGASWALVPPEHAGVAREPWWQAWESAEAAAKGAAWSVILDNPPRDEWIWGGPLNGGREILPGFDDWAPRPLRPGDQDAAAFEAYRNVWFPILEAAAAGLWSCWILDAEVLAAPRPVLRFLDERLHSADGPAISWPDGAQLWFWRGVRVPRDVVETPEAITVPRMGAERNAEVRAAMIDRYGKDRFLRDAGARRVHEDAFGVLYRVEGLGGEPVAIVRLRNATPDPDGTFREYFLRVPPTMRTAREAVAWTFSLRESEYDPTVQA